MAQLPHISRHPSTNLTKICHIDQSYPKTEGKTTRKDIRIVPRQEAKPPGKTSELSFLGHRWRNCLLSWDNSDRCGIFWLGWLMDVGRYEGVAPSMWAFPAWFWRMSGSCAIYVPKKAAWCWEKKWGPSSALWQFATLLGPGKRSPPSPPKKGFFLSFPKETWHLVGSVFWGGPKWKTGTALEVSPHFFLNIKLPF